MLVVEVNGLRLVYNQSGSGADVVFVHGIPTDYRAWDAQVPVFSQKYRVLCYSRRNAEPNNNPISWTDSTIENNADDLRELIQKVANPPVHLVGHSYGGFIAAYLASKNPALVKSLVLIEPGISTILIQDPESRGQMLSLLLHHPSVALAAGSYLRRYYSPLLKAYHNADLDKSLGLFLDGLMNRSNALDTLPDNVQRMVKDNARTIGELDAKLPGFGKTDASRMSMPTLLMHGGNGTKVFRAIVQQLAKVIPNNKLVAIPNSSHFPHFENSLKFNETVLNFLEQNQ